MTARSGATFHGRDAGHRDRILQSAQAHLVVVQSLLQEAVHPEPLQTPHHLSQGEATGQQGNIGVILANLIPPFKTAQLFSFCIFFCPARNLREKEMQLL